MYNINALDILSDTIPLALFEHTVQFCDYKIISLLLTEFNTNPHWTIKALILQYKFKT